MKVGITGVTGFVGSAMACQFLKDGHEITAISRNDPHAQRTKAAIRDAWLGFGFAIKDLDESFIRVVSIDFNNPQSIGKEIVSSLDVFWHVAAEMSYSSKSFKRSFQQNVTNTASLHRYLAENGKSLKRFYYVSTAYTGGFANDGLIEEVIHAAPQVDNVYQAMKWTAELTLDKQSSLYDLPVSLFRPSIVVGHSKTGYRANSNFGIYGFIKASFLASKYNYKTLRFDLIDDAEANLIPIDHLSLWASLLSQREDQGSDFEIFNANSSSLVKIIDMAELVKGILGVEILIAKPLSDIDRRINRMTEKNASFAKKSWYFESKNLKKVLGEKYVSCHVDDLMLRTIVHRYIEDLENEITIESSPFSLTKITHRAKAALKTMGINIKNTSDRGVTIKIEADQARSLFRERLSGFLQQKRKSRY